MNNKRLSQIDAWRGFAIFCVVLYHSIIVYPINLQENNYLKSLYDYISVYNMPLFFFISGICFSYKGDYKDYIQKKIKRILIPYFTVSVLNFVCKLILPSLVNGQLNIGTFISDILLYGGEYWFLYVMFIILLIYPLIILISKKVNKYIIEIVFVVLSLIKVKTNLFCLVPLLRYFVFFNTGYILKDLVKSNIKNNYSSITFVLSIMLSVMLFVINIKFDSRLLEMINAFLIIFSTYLIINNGIFINIFEKYGKYSLQIYCLNGFLLVLARTLICKVTSLAIIIIPFIVFVCLCMSYICIKHIISKIKVACLLLGL